MKAPKVPIADNALDAIEGILVRLSPENIEELRTIFGERVSPSGQLDPATKTFLKGYLQPYVDPIGIIVTEGAGAWATLTSGPTPVLPEHPAVVVDRLFNVLRTVAKKEKTDLLGALSRASAPAVLDAMAATAKLDPYTKSAVGWLGGILKNKVGDAGLAIIRMGVLRKGSMSTATTTDTPKRPR